VAYEEEVFDILGFGGLGLASGVWAAGLGAVVAGESGVASRSAGSATAVHDAPVSGKSVRVLAEGHLPMLRFMLRGDELVRGCPRTIDDC